MYGPEHVDLIAFHILGTNLKKEGCKRYHKTEGLFNPFESLPADSYVLRFIKKNWTEDLLERFAIAYGKLQQERMVDALTIFSNFKCPIQRAGDYTIAALRTLGIEI